MFNDPAIVRVLRDAGLDEWLTLDEAAIIAKSTVRVLRDAGRRPDGLKLGSASGEPRVTRRHLDEWLSTEPKKKPRKEKSQHSELSNEPANDTEDARTAARAAVARAAAKIASAK